MGERAQREVDFFSCFCLSLEKKETMVNEKIPNVASYYSVKFISYGQYHMTVHRHCSLKVVKLLM